MSNIKKCKNCNGTGNIMRNRIDTGEHSKIKCPICEGTGVPLTTTIEEQYHEASELDASSLHIGDSGFIEFEEDDYEV